MKQFANIGEIVEWGGWGLDGVCVQTNIYLMYVEIAPYDHMKNWWGERLHAPNWLSAPRISDRGDEEVVEW